MGCRVTLVIIPLVVSPGYDLAAQEDMALQMILSRRKEARA